MFGSDVFKEVNDLIMPIVAYGDRILRTKAHEVRENSADLQQLIDNMIVTMRGADGAGLAAPQVGRSLRLFVADLTEAWHAIPPDLRPNIPEQPMVCINPVIVETGKRQADFGEGCLSIPMVVEDVRRPYRVKMRYLDRDFREQEIVGVSYVASVLQHEYDHLEGRLHIDYLTDERKLQIQATLRDIETGVVRPNYAMRFRTSV